MADKKTRVDLENLFSSGKIPTQSNFADLIASGVNQKDDGLQKATDTPLKIQAPVTVETDAKAPKDLILFYEKLEDAAPKWRMGTRAGGLEISRGAQFDFLIDANGSVGIGTNEPKAKLHVEGDARVTGNTQVNGKLTIASQIDSPGRMHISGEELLYLLNKSGVVVGKEWGGTGNLNVQGSIGIGIGTTTPGFPLTFADASGDKISLRGQSGANFGFGVQTSLMQIHTDTDAADIAFGSGSSGAFKETMRVKGNGKVGIGAKEINGVFDVQGKMHVKDNGTIEVPGSKNTFNGMIETFYANNDRYGVGQFNGGIMAMYTSEAYAPSSLQFGLMTGDSSFKSQVKIDHDGNLGIGTTDVKARLHVKGGAIMPAEGNSESAGILFPPDAFGGSGDRAYIRYYARTGETVESTTLEIGNQNDADDHIALMPAGNVGIGTIKPTKAKLVIEGSRDPGNYLLRGYMDANGSIKDHNKQWGAGSPASIWASNEIVGTAIRVQSDSRIKKVIELPDTGKDLLFINKLNPVKYRFVDTVENGYEIKSGFIAQDVEKINPAMVKRSTNFIPNVYRQAEEIEYSASEKTLCISLANSHDCVAGDKVRIITDKRELELTVESVISENKLILAGCEEKTEKVFVFGKEVRDFLTLDYNSIFTKGIGAIQELSNQLKELQEDCDQRKAELEAIKSQLKENKEVLNTRLNKTETVC